MLNDEFKIMNIENVSRLQELSPSLGGARGGLFEIRMTNDEFRTQETSNLEPRT